VEIFENTSDQYPQSVQDLKMPWLSESIWTFPSVSSNDWTQRFDVIGSKEKFERRNSVFGEGDSR